MQVWYLEDIFMDVFFEQLITIKKDIKTYLAYIGIAISAILLMTVSLMLSRGLAVIVVFLVFWGAYKLYSMFNIEYEYIITNSTMDIDKIIAKSSRKRILNFDLTEVERIEKYHAQLPQDILNDALFACNKDDENAYLLIIHPEGKAKQSIVIAPNERMRDAMKKFLPKYIADNLI